VHLNRYAPLDYRHMPERDRLLLHFNFHALDLERAVQDETYLVEHFVNRFVETLYRLARRRGADTAVEAAHVEALLRRGEAVLALGLAHIQAAKQDLARRGGGRQAED
jgi:hypothetical protein